jgi:NAD(P)-dependent dehydrogenase (short-subunit alcohol dehydrogenase family)
MPTVMIMGASRDNGLELARQYASDGWRVHATTRMPARSGPLGVLAGDIVLHALEVRDTAQVAAFAAAVEHEGNG